MKLIACVGSARTGASAVGPAAGGFSERRLIGAKVSPLPHGHSGFEEREGLVHQFVRRVKRASPGFERAHERKLIERFSFVLHQPLT